MQIGNDIPLQYQNLKSYLYPKPFLESALINVAMDALYSNVQLHNKHIICLVFGIGTLQGTSSCPGFVVIGIHHLSPLSPFQVYIAVHHLGQWPNQHCIHQQRYAY